MKNYMESKNSSLYLFTDEYPVGEFSFITPEIEILAKTFTTIENIPKKTIPDIKNKKCRVITNNFLSIILKKWNLLTILESLILFSQKKILLYECKENIFYLSNINGLFRLISFQFKAYLVMKWVCTMIQTKNLDLSKIIFYTYWFDYVTLGLCYAKKTYPDMIVISRTHGADLYSERHSPPYIPFQGFLIKTINHLYTASEHGREYLIQKYPQFHTKIDVSYLGVPDPEYTTLPSSDGIFRILSCSSLVPIKRVDRIIDVLALIGKQNPNKQYFWTHIGGGPLFEVLKLQSQLKFPSNVKYEYKGNIENYEVLNYYHNHCVDLFINTSDSEGTPVSIQEAQSFGVPVLATAVGGNSEIVNNINGFLVPIDATSNQIAELISSMVSDPLKMLKKRSESKNNWMQNYNSSINHQRFADKLYHLLEVIV